MSTLKRTIRRAGLGLALVAVTGLGLTLGAPDSQARRTKKVRKAGAKADRSTRFYDFDDLLIDGDLKKPATLYTRALKSPRFDRLLRLQKSFLDQLLSTARYPSLRWFR